MSSPVPSHQHHPNADQSVEFKGYAAFAPKQDVKEWSYNPPKLADDWVEVEISHCGICGSDVHTIDSGWFPSNYPVIVGHEIIGRVVAAGSAVTNVKVGDRVGIGAQCGACFNKDKSKSCPECAKGCENNCRQENVWTYNAKYPDGQVAQGGYANRKRCQAQFAFKIPDAIDSASAAPLMCGGVTVFAPLARHMKKGMTVGVVGIGGLGHMGIMFARALADELGGGTTVTAISTSARKRDDALKMGAHDFLDTSDKEAIKNAFRRFDFILSTANGSDMAVSEWISMLVHRGTLISVGAPEEPIKLTSFDLLIGEKVIGGSAIGSPAEIKTMLEYAAKYNIRPIIERLPMERVNEGIQKVRDGSVRYRVVLENPTQ